MGTQLRNVVHRDGQLWLEAPDGGRLRVGSGGVLVGRDRRCDLLLDDPSASRQHALFLGNQRGARVMALGRADVLVNGEQVRTHVLRAGDVVGLPGLALRVVSGGGEGARARWTVSTGGLRVPVADAGLRIGLGSDVAVSGWEGAVSLVPEGDRLRVTCARPFVRNGVHCQSASVLCLAGDVLVPVGGGTPLSLDEIAVDAPVTSPSSDGWPTSIDLQLLARGGRIAVAFDNTVMVAYLPERRFALVVGLLRPPDPYTAGDDIPDDVLLRVVWPRSPGKSRVDMNVLLRRLRSDFDGAGVPTRLVVRGAGGGSTRFVLDPECVVTFVS